MRKSTDVPYTEDLSPFGRPHVVESKKSYVPFRTLSEKWTPTRKVAAGCLVATTKSPFLFGKVDKIRKKTKKAKLLSVWINDSSRDRAQIRLLKNCVAVPTKNEFVRDNSTKKWYIVATHEQTTCGLFPIFWSPPPAGACRLLLHAKKISCYCSFDICTDPYFLLFLFFYVLCILTGARSLAPCTNKENLGARSVHLGCIIHKRKVKVKTYTSVYACAVDKNIYI